MMCLPEESYPCISFNILQYAYVVYPASCLHASLLFGMRWQACLVQFLAQLLLCVGIYAVVWARLSLCTCMGPEIVEL